jgi:hypothetical protein
MTTTFDDKLKYFNTSPFPKRLVVLGPTEKLRENHTGQYILLVGPKMIRHLMTTVIAGLAENEEVRVLDCGNTIVTLPSR